MEKTYTLDVSVIIVNYNTLKLTSECIDSVIAQTKDISYEIILIDNASVDGSVERFQKDTRIKFIANPENVGFGNANNKAIEQAQGKYLFLLNSDTLLLNNAIKIFFDYFEEISKTIKLGAIGTTLMYPDMTPAHSYVNTFPTIWRPINEFYDKLFRTILHLKPNGKDRKIPNNISMDVVRIIGADLFLPHALFTEVQGFDPNIFLYYEEDDLQYKIHKLGYKRQIIKGPQIIHYEGYSSKNQRNKGVMSPQRHLMPLNSWIYYLRKWRGNFYAAVAKYLYALLVGIPYCFRRSFKDNKAFFSQYFKL